MSYRIEITDTAQRDFESIYEHIAFTLCAPDNAARQLGRIEKAIMSLDEMPLRFKAYEFEPWRSRKMRVMPIDNYVVLYTPDKDSGVVTINRVFYGGRDINEILNERTN